VADEKRKIGVGKLGGVLRENGKKGEED